MALDAERVTMETKQEAPGPCRRGRLHASILMVAATAFVVSLFPVFDSDLFWHLRTGYRILETVSIETQDIYSYTAAGERFNNHEWLADVGLALGHRAGDFEGLVLLKAVAAALLSLLVAWAAVERGARGTAVGWGLLYGLLLFRYRLMVKPELLSFLLLMVFDALATRYLRRGRPLALVAMVVLAVIWANCHLGVVLGLALLGAHAVGEGLGRRLGLATAGGRGRPLWLAGAALAAAAATLINPYGLGLYEPVLKIYASGPVKALGVREWEPPSIEAFGLFFLLAPLASLVLLASARQVRLQDLGLWLTGGALALVSLRHVALFALLSAPILARQLTVALGNLAARLGWRSWWRPGLSLAGLGAACAWATFSLLSPHASLLHQDQSRHFGPGLGMGPRSAPQGSVACIEAHALEGPVLNSYHLGGYLIWRSWPRIRVFLDGRHYVYEGFLGWLYANGGRSAEEVLTRYDVRLGLVAHTDRVWGDGFRRLPRFRVLCFDDLATLYVRQDVLDSRPGLIAFEWLDPSDLSLAWLAELSPEQRREAYAEALRGVQTAPDSARAWMLVGMLARRQGDLQSAVDAYGRAVALDPGQASFWNNLGAALLGQERPQQALSAFREARRLEPHDPGMLYNEGLTRARLGQLWRARRLLRKACGLPGCPSAAHLSLGLLETDRARASQQLERYLELALDPAGRERAVRRLEELERASQ